MGNRNEHRHNKKKKCILHVVRRTDRVVIDDRRECLPMMDGRVQPEV